MSNDIKHVSSDLRLALRAQAVQADDFDPELLYPGVEEEEEEEEEDPDDEPGDDDGEEDRGDDVDPSLADDDEPDPGKADDQEQEQEEELDPDALAELAGESKAIRIPHARFNEVNEALKAERATRLQLEEELARTKGQVPAPAVEKPGDTQTYDFDAAEDRFMDALLDGDKDLAKSIRAEIRAEEKKQYSEQTAQTAQKAADTELKKRDAEHEQGETQKVLTAAITKYPFLNHQGEEADADAIEEVIARRDLYMKQGMSLSKALSTAVEKVAPRYAPQEQEQEREKPNGRKAASVEQIERNLEREKRIPSAMPGVGERGKDIDYAKLSEEEFDALPDAEKRKARGDFVSEKD